MKSNSETPKKSLSTIGLVSDIKEIMSAAQSAAATTVSRAMIKAKTQMWSVRTLDRNVSTQYYYRLLASPRKEEVKTEMAEKTSGDEYRPIEAAQFFITR